MDQIWWLDDWTRWKPNWCWESGSPWMFGLKLGSFLTAHSCQEHRAAIEGTPQTTPFSLRNFWSNRLQEVSPMQRFSQWNSPWSNQLISPCWSSRSPPWTMAAMVSWFSITNEWFIPHADMVWNCPEFDESFHFKPWIIVILMKKRWVSLCFFAPREENLEPSYPSFGAEAQRSRDPGVMAAWWEYGNGR